MEFYMALEAYRKKRDFKKTNEPAGKAHKKSVGKLIFVVQKHHASHLHYDFRLEIDDVLKSWAIPKGPSLDPKDKRLAVMTEDHPLDYAKFSGVIPAGEYGAGTVEIWDHGTWEPLADPLIGLKQGRLHFVLHGKKLHGTWALVAFKNEPKNWLLIKANDELRMKN